MTTNTLPQPQYITETNDHLPIGGYPARIYKCRDWKDKYHKEIITKRQIHFAHAINFPDKFDCRFPIEFDFSFETFFEAFKEKIKKQIILEGIRPNTFNVLRRAQLIHNNVYGTDEKKELKKREYHSFLADKTYVFSAV